MALIWCILTNSVIGICFKLFPKWKITALHAIVINYTVCFLLGLTINLKGGGIPFDEIIHTGWFKFDVLLGFLFILGFNLTSYAISNFGIAQSIIMQKMSIILTVAFAILFFRDPFGWTMAFGLLISIMSILAINHTKQKKGAQKPLHAILPLAMVLLFAAAIEIVLLYVQKANLVGNQQLMFTTLGFGMAAGLGWLYVIFSLATKKSQLKGRDVIAGLVLGIPNFFSIYLLLKLLEKGWEGSILYPLLNVSILLLSAIAAIFIFREPLSKVNKWGIAFAIMAIIVFALAENNTI
jgi:drug/metabolite transporter (DMT)-like permease